MTNIALVLGNGFDLDLGLKTRYCDFWEAKKSVMKEVQHLFISEAIIEFKLLRFLQKL